MKYHKVYIGGWFQRTTLHLTEIWDFVKHGKVTEGFSPEIISGLRQSLLVKDAARCSGGLEYISIITSSKIGVRIYEDGLIILECEVFDIDESFFSIKDYYENRLSKALSYIFSKGAPVPKELANIKTILPYILTVTGADKSKIEDLFSDFSEDIYSIVSTKNVEVYRSSGLIVINNIGDEKLAREIIESQIFFREFKSQLHRYLSIHRVLWEKIRAIKEGGKISGTEIDKVRNELTIYEKTINLIQSRINQMPAYVRTRQKLTNIEKVDQYLQPLFQLKFETLLDTHEYVGHLWAMTGKYLSSAMETLSQLQQESTKNTISSLQLITTIGVVSGLIGYMSREVWPTISLMGISYLVLLLVVTWVVNFLVSRYYKSRKYDISSKDFEKDIR